MRRVAFAAALMGAAVLAAGGPAADGPKAAGEGAEAELTAKEFGKLMRDAHRGEKSPHARVEAELKKDVPDWERVAADAKAFTAMAGAFKRVELGYTSPAKYDAAAAALAKAAGAKDKAAAAAAFGGLQKSCSACHGYGNPAGRDD